MFLYIPFICITVGTIINWRGLPAWGLKLSDTLMNIALMLLMVVIGLNIGLSETVMKNLGSIGLKCLLISLGAIWCSVGLTVLCEKTVMPLEKIRLQLLREKQERQEKQANGSNGGEGFGFADEAQDGKKGKIDPLLIAMPGFIALGILVGYFLLPKVETPWLDTLLTISLVFLYTGAGVTLASNKEVFSYIRRLGFRILFLPLSIFIGCIMGGFIMGLLLDVPLNWSVLSASGMGYYSLSGAFLTETWGIEAGVYGFIVNVSRDVFTVAMLPLLLRVSKGSPIASGAGGCMDTMLIPVSKAVGPELGLVALISGTITTLVVPIWLPIGVQLFGGI